MYVKMWDRAKIIKIGDFIRTGEAMPDCDKQTMEERRKQYLAEFYEGLRSYKNEVLAYDWSKCKTETEIKDMESVFYEDAAIATMQLHDLAFDMGLQIGMFLRSEQAAEIDRYYNIEGKQTV